MMMTNNYDSVEVPRAVPCRLANARHNDVASYSSVKFQDLSFENEGQGCRRFDKCSTYLHRLSNCKRTQKKTLLSTVIMEQMQLR